MPEKSVAIFDFDGTLIKGDSLIWFIIGMTGWRHAVRNFVVSLLHPLPGQMDWKTAVKAAWLCHALAGKSLDTVKPVALRMRKKRRWIVEVRDALMRHKAEGATIVIATGALELYIHELCEGLPVDVVLCTGMERVGSRLTGRMLGGNCVRAEKAKRVAGWLAANGPFEVSYGYGNAPSDLPFLELMTHKKII